MLRRYGVVHIHNVKSLYSHEEGGLPCRALIHRTSNDGRKDYIFQNAQATKLASITAKSRRYSDEEEKADKWLQKQGFGQVPAYLQDYKACLAKQHAEEQASLFSKFLLC